MMALGNGTRMGKGVGEKLNNILDPHTHPTAL